MIRVSLFPSLLDFAFFHFRNSSFPFFAIPWFAFCCSHRLAILYFSVSDILRFTFPLFSASLFAFSIFSRFCGLLFPQFSVSLLPYLLSRVLLFSSFRFCVFFSVRPSPFRFSQISYYAFRCFHRFAFLCSSISAILRFAVSLFPDSRFVVSIVSRSCVFLFRQFSVSMVPCFCNPMLSRSPLPATPSRFHKSKVSGPCCQVSRRAPQTTRNAFFRWRSRSVVVPLSKSEKTCFLHPRRFSGVERGKEAV